MAARLKDMHSAIFDVTPGHCFGVTQIDYFSTFCDADHAAAAPMLCRVLKYFPSSIARPDPGNRVYGTECKKLAHYLFTVTSGTHACVLVGISACTDYRRVSDTAG